MRPWLLFFVLLLSVGEVYGTSILDGVMVEVEPPMIYPGEEVNVTFTAWNPTDSRHILVIKYGGFPEEFEGPSTTAVLILEPGETESETLRFRTRPNIRVKNYFPYYDLIDEAYDITSGGLVYRNATGNATEPLWHVIRMYDPVLMGLRRGTTYNVSIDDEGVNVSLELVNTLNRTHRITLAGKDLEEREFLLKPGDEAKTSFRLEVPARLIEYNFSFNATEEFHNGTGFALLYQWEYKIEFKHLTLSEKLLAFLERHPWVIRGLQLILGLLILWALRRRIRAALLEGVYRIELIQTYVLYLRSRYREESKRFLAVASSILLVDLLVFIRYQYYADAIVALLGNTTVLLAFLALAFALHPSTERELVASQRLRDISPRVLIVDFLLLLLLAAYLISFRSEAGARAVADYAFYVLVAAVVLRAHQFWREGR